MSSLKHPHIGELDELIGAIRQTYGHDFSNYAQTSFRRRVVRCMDKARVKTVSEMSARLTTDKPFFEWFLESVTVNVTEMFRDPDFYKELRTNVIPTLASYPTIKIWHAGCATGEEVYSMAILLNEAGLLNRTRIYATDINPVNLEKARQGIISSQHLNKYTSNYRQAGGTHEFSAYYTARHNHAILDAALRRNVTFEQHNLVTDQVFNQFHLVCCRNVLIYFNKKLQNRAIQLFHDSLVPLGYLTIGLKESLLFADIKSDFDAVSPAANVFRRKT